MSGTKIKHFLARSSKASLLVVFLASVVISSASLIFAGLQSPKALADPQDPPAFNATYYWENNVTIMDSLGNFWRNDNGSSGIGRYYLADDKDSNGCIDYIDFSTPSAVRGQPTRVVQTIADGHLLTVNTRKSGELHVLSPSTSATNKNCQDKQKTVAISNDPAHILLYYWESKDTIKRLQGSDEMPALTYIRSETNPYEYVEEGNGQCLDSIIVSADKVNATYKARTTIKGEEQAIAWYVDGNVAKPRANNSDGSNCYVTDGFPIGLTYKFNADKTRDEATGLPATGLAGGTGETDSCYGFNPFSWMLCPVLDIADGVYSFAQKFIKQLLYIDPDTIEDTGLKQSWSIMRGFASVLIVLVAMFMIASQVFSFEFMSAYTVKKVLPRLVIAAILIQLSWFIFTTMILIVNGIGTGLYALLTAPFSGAGGGADIMNLVGVLKEKSPGTTAISETGIFAASVAVLVGTAGAIVFGGAMLTIVLAAMGVIIAILITIFTLIVRKILILLLLALAPLALVAWILPNTQKFWDMWWKLFSRLLLMFPLIMLLFAAGVIAANILASSEAEQSVFTYLLVVIAYFAPLFLIPATFKFAGGLFTSIISVMDKAGNRAKGSSMFGMRDRAKERRENSPWAATRKLRQGERTRDAQLENSALLKGTGTRSNLMRWRSGTTEEARRRAIANASATIASAKDQEIKEESLLAKSEVKRLASFDTTAGRSDYEKYELVRSQSLALAAQGLETGTINGQAVTGLQSLAKYNAIEALGAKDSPTVKDSATGMQYTGLTDYLATDKGYLDLRNLAGDSGEAMEVLSKRLPTAVKGADKATFAPVRESRDDEGNIVHKFVNGFDDGIAGYESLGKQQQEEIRDGLESMMIHDPAKVVARLSILGRGSSKPGQIDELSAKFAAQGLNLAEFRGNANAVLGYDAGTGKFTITSSGTPPPTSGGPTPPPSTGGGSPPPASGPGPNSTGGPGGQPSPHSGGN